MALDAGAQHTQIAETKIVERTDCCTDYDIRPQDGVLLGEKRANAKQCTPCQQGWQLSLDKAHARARNTTQSNVALCVCC